MMNNSNFPLPEKKYSIRIVRSDTTPTSKKNSIVTARTNEDLLSQISFHLASLSELPKSIILFEIEDPKIQVEDEGEEEEEMKYSNPHHALPTDLSLEHESLRLAMQIQAEEKEQERRRAKDLQESELLAKKIEQEERDRLRALDLMEQEKLKIEEDERNFKLTIKMLEEEKAAENIQMFGLDPHGETECIICMETVKNDCVQVLFPSCDHKFCRDCLRKDLELRVKENRLPLQCAVCKSRIPQHLVQNLIHPELFEKMLKFGLNNFVQENEDFSCCMTPGCQFVFSFQEGTTYFECKICKKEYCLQCRCEWHKGSNCKKFQLWKKENSEGDDRFENFVKGQNLKQCVKCKFWIQKNQGCKHMTCRCGYQFCFICGEKWKTCNH